LTKPIVDKITAAISCTESPEILCWGWIRRNELCRLKQWRCDQVIGNVTVGLEDKKSLPCLSDLHVEWHRFPIDSNVHLEKERDARATHN
jgi:hypothetical protein